MSKIVDNLLGKLDQFKRKVMTDNDEVVDGSQEESPMNAEENEDLIVVVTGGDTFFFENALKNSIFADQNLVLKGLNIILKYNEDK